MTPCQALPLARFSAIHSLTHDDLPTRILRWWDGENPSSTRCVLRILPHWLYPIFEHVNIRSILDLHGIRHVVHCMPEFFNRIETVNAFHSLFPLATKIVFEYVDVPAVSQRTLRLEVQEPIHFIRYLIITKTCNSRILERVGV